VIERIPRVFKNLRAAGVERGGDLLPHDDERAEVLAGFGHEARERRVRGQGRARRRVAPVAELHGRANPLPEHKNVERTAESCSLQSPRRCSTIPDTTQHRNRGLLHAVRRPNAQRRATYGGTVALLPPMHAPRSNVTWSKFVKIAGRWAFQYTALDDCARYRVLRLYRRVHQHSSLAFLAERRRAFPFRIGSGAAGRPR
jgi:hypothetical protein